MSRGCPDCVRSAWVRPALALILLLQLTSSLAAQDAGELYLAAGREDALRAARAIIASDPDAALVTIDAEGQPRVRTVTTRPPEADMTIWIATRPGTRKVEQIRANPAVTLYYNNDPEGQYVSVMGTATLHDDEATKRDKNWYPHERLRLFWPSYPEDFLLIRVEPRWIEVIGAGIEGHPESWRPQAVVFED